MQDGKTPLESAIFGGSHRVVEYFVKNCNMDLSQFDAVCNIDKIFCVCLCVYACVCVCVSVSVSV